MVNLHGPIVALLTPFDASGNIDWQAFKTYLSALFSWGIRSVITNGTTGEFPSLTLNERQQLVEFVRDHFPGTIINNVSSTCIDDVRDLIAGTQEYGDAILMLPPYYYAACRNDGLCGFFAKALSGTSLPALLYNFPQHTGNKLDNELIAMLLNKGIALAGIKDSSGDLENALAYQSRFPQLKIFFASDSKGLAALQTGLAGSVTGGANPLPELLIALQKHFAVSGDKARSLQQCLNAWNEFRETRAFFEIPLVKAAMGARIENFPLHVRPPFTPIPAEEIGQVRSVIVTCLSDFKTILAAA